jgi:EAL domain-containing protein (putative c-di-GMP-specific phosphodiesterase class I)
VVAEGVETDEQANLLRLLDCHEMQGYWVCRPVPAALFEARYVAAAAPSPEGSRAGLRDLSSA